MRRLRRVAMIALTTIGMGYLAVVIAAFLLQRKMIFPAPAGAGSPTKGLVRGEGFVAMHFPGTPTIVHLHGNAESLWESEWLAAKFIERGLGFYAVEYPGYGLAASTPVSEEAISTAVEAALVALEKTVPRDQLILQGQSLGSGVAVEMARRGHGSKLMLLAAYTSIPDVAAGIFPFLPVRADPRGDDRMFRIPERPLITPRPLASRGRCGTAGTSARRSRRGTQSRSTAAR